MVARKKKNFLLFFEYKPRFSVLREYNVTIGKIKDELPTIISRGIMKIRHIHYKYSNSQTDFLQHIM